MTERTIAGYCVFAITREGAKLGRVAGLPRYHDAIQAWIACRLHRTAHPDQWFTVWAVDADGVMVSP